MSFSGITNVRSARVPRVLIPNGDTSSRSDAVKSCKRYFKVLVSLIPWNNTNTDWD